jgi:type II secretory pathway pseudopilin PulG
MNYGAIALIIVISIYLYFRWKAKKQREEEEAAAAEAERQAQEQAEQEAAAQHANGEGYYDEHGIWKSNSGAYDPIATDHFLMGSYHIPDDLRGGANADMVSGYNPNRELYIPDNGIGYDSMGRNMDTPVAPAGAGDDNFAGAY